MARIPIKHLHPSHGLVEVVDERKRNGQDYIVVRTASHELEGGEDLFLMVPDHCFDDVMADRPGRDEAMEAMAILKGDTEPGGRVKGTDWRGRVTLLKAAMKRAVLTEMASLYVQVMREGVQPVSVQQQVDRLRVALAGGIAVGRNCNFSTAINLVDEVDEHESQLVETAA